MEQEKEKAQSRTKLKITIVVLLFAVFMAVLAYPNLAQIYNSWHDGKVAMIVDDSAMSMTEEQRQEMLEMAQLYNEELASGIQILPDAFEGITDEVTSVYDALLDVSGDGAMGVITIPKIDVSLVIYHGTSADVLKKGAGHLEGSSLPIGGESTHAVISAHRGLPRKKLFTDLDLLEIGDRFTIKVLGNELTYEVYGIETADPGDVDSLAIQQGQDLVTLVTCTPYGINTMRLYVHAKRVMTEAGEDVVVTDAGRWSFIVWLRKYWWVLVEIGLAALLIWNVRSIRRHSS